MVDFSVANYSWQFPPGKIVYNICHQNLRGPATILFISRDTFNNSIAKLFRACLPGISHKYRAICCKMGYRTDMSV